MFHKSLVFAWIPLDALGFFCKCIWIRLDRHLHSLAFSWTHLNFHKFTEILTNSLGFTTEDLWHISDFDHPYVWVERNFESKRWIHLDLLWTHSLLCIPTSTCCPRLWALSPIWVRGYSLTHKKEVRDGLWFAHPLRGCAGGTLPVAPQLVKSRDFSS